ncbi:LysR family transcriptional regulator [Amycolatopsis anabasis]|uniref:LysR family transcriptional regulator n=1 Tax=Amycolatopsis anabasis TaxID=1840409 RepID=UPI00131C9A7F|nr:LysR family transcriptional regulator [Amycolatopsis anabasis]
MIDAVAETRSISKAAVRLGLTQPAVSTMLRRVEGHLGVRLFIRSPEGVAPTPIGRDVATRARAVLSGIDDLNATLAREPGGSSPVPSLRLGAQACPALTKLSGRLGMLFSSIRVQLRVDQGGGRVVPLLDSGALDVGLVQEPVGRATVLPVGVERFVLVEREPTFVGLSADSPLAARDVVELGELAGHEWVDDPVDDGPWPAYFRAACAAAGFAPQVSFWSTDWQLAAEVVRSGRGIGLYHPTAPPREGIVFRRLRGDPLAHRVVLLWRREANSAARRLRTALSQIYLELVQANPVYARWWAEHPDAHPALPGTAPANPLTGEGVPFLERAVNSA